MSKHERRFWVAAGCLVAAAVAFVAWLEARGRETRRAQDAWYAAHCRFVGTRVERGSYILCYECNDGTRREVISR